jgi:hypothetical protein
MSWNAVRRLRRWGYHHVAWYGPGTDGWTEDQLVEIITRDCLIGVALPKPGVTTNVITATRSAMHPTGD